MDSRKYHEKHLSDFDVFWLRNDCKENQMVINFVFCMDKNIEKKQIDEYLAKWSENYPRFRSQAVHRGGLRYDWVPYPDFEPAKYGCIGEGRLKAPTQEAVTEFVDQALNEPLGRGETKCMWKMIRVDNVPWGGCMLIWRIHHCVCDGMATVEICRSIFQENYVSEPSKAEPSPRRRRKRGMNFIKLGKMICPVMIGIGAGYLIGLSALASIAIGVSLMATLAWGKPMYRLVRMASGLNGDTKTPLKNALCGTKSTAVIGNMITVANSKALAEAVSTEKRRYTINDVLIAMVGGAFRRYYKTIGLNPDKASLGCVVPVNIRGTKEPVKCENKFTLVYAKIPVHLEKAIDRVKYMHDRMNDLKYGFDPLTGVLFLKALSYLPQSLMDMAVRHFNRNAAMVVTNVNARDKPMYFGDSMVKDAYGWVPSAGGIGIGVSLISYMGKLNVGLIADKAQVPNIHSLADCFRQEWRAMNLELGGKQKA